MTLVIKTWDGRRDHKAIQLEKGQSIIIEAVGADYINFEGYKAEAETRIGLSYAKLCDTLVPGNIILIADGTISIKVCCSIGCHQL